MSDTSDVGGTSTPHVDDTAEVRPLSPETGGLQRQFPLRLVIEISVAVVIVAVLIFFGVTLSSQSNKIDAQANDIAALKHQVNADSTALAANSRSSAKSLQSQLSSLKSVLNTTNVTAASTASSLSGLKTTVTQMQGQLANICSSTAVSNEVSTINGEETGSGSGYNQYYGDLLGVLAAVCQSSSSSG